MFRKRFDNRYNICGINIRELRMSTHPKISQRELADKLQLINVDMDKNTIQLIEAGKRTVTDVELIAFASIFRISTDILLKRRSD